MTNERERIRVLYEYKRKKESVVFKCFIQICHRFSEITTLTYIIKQDVTKKKVIKKCKHTLTHAPRLRVCNTRLPGYRGRVHSETQFKLFSFRNFMDSKSPQPLHLVAGPTSNSAFRLPHNMCSPHPSRIF